MNERNCTDGILRLRGWLDGNEAGRRRRHLSCLDERMNPIGIGLCLGTYVADTNIGPRKGDFGETTTNSIRPN